MTRWLSFYIYTIFIIIVLVGAYMRIIPTEIAIVPMYDSIGHFVLYGVWFYLLHVALNKKLVFRSYFSIPLAFLLLFPVVTIEEFAQQLSSARTFSLIDLWWGFAGMCLFWFFSSRYQTLK